MRLYAPRLAHTRAARRPLVVGRLLVVGPLFLVGAALGLLLSLGGCGGPDAPVVVSPATYDFGRVLKGARPSHVFRLTNNSKQVVQFTAQANCSCFAVAQGLRPLDPGHTLEFRVLFDTTALPAQEVRGKWISIHTDHPDVGSIIVPLKGEIYRVYTFGPDSFNLGKIDGRPANYKPRVVTIRPLEGHEIRLRGSFQMPPVFDVTGKPAQGGLDVSLTLKKDARRPVGPFNPRIRLDLEVIAPDGEMRLEERIVRFTDGFWLLAR